MKWKFIYLIHFDEWLWLEIEGMNIVWLYIIHITSRRFFWYLSIRYIFKYLQFQICMCKKVIQKNCICLSNWLNDKDIKLLERFFFCCCDGDWEWICDPVWWIKRLIGIELEIHFGFVLSIVILLLENFNRRFHTYLIQSEDLKNHCYYILASLEFVVIYDLSMDGNALQGKFWKFFFSVGKRKITQRRAFLYNWVNFAWHLWVTLHPTAASNFENLKFDNF